MILEKDFLFRRYNKELAGKLPVFDCGDEDLNAFFQEDAFNYDAQLLGRSYSTIKKMFCIFIQMTTTSFPFFLRKNVKRSCITAFLRTKFSKLGRCTSIWQRSCKVLVFVIFDRG